MVLNWGLGIEHEMRLRFSNKFDILNINDKNIDNIYKKFGYIPEYLFISSTFLLKIYNKYVNSLLKHYEDELENDLLIKNKDDYNYLMKIIIEKKEYPFDNINFFNIKNQSKTIDYLIYYFNNYIKINCIFLDLSFHFYNYFDIYDYHYLYFNKYEIINKIIKKMNLDDIKKVFNELITGITEKEYIKAVMQRVNYITKKVFANCIEIK